MIHFHPCLLATHNMSDLLNTTYIFALKGTKIGNNLQDLTAEHGEETITSLLEQEYPGHVQYQKQILASRTTCTPGSLCTWTINFDGSFMPTYIRPVFAPYNTGRIPLKKCKSLLTNSLWYPNTMTARQMQEQFEQTAEYLLCDSTPTPVAPQGEKQTWFCIFHVSSENAPVNHHVSQMFLQSGVRTIIHDPIENEQLVLPTGPAVLFKTDLEYVYDTSEMELLELMDRYQRDMRLRFTFVQNWSDGQCHIMKNYIRGCLLGTEQVDCFVNALWQAVLSFNGNESVRGLICLYYVLHYHKHLVKMWWSCC